MTIESWYNIWHDVIYILNIVILLQFFIFLGKVWKKGTLDILHQLLLTK